MGVGKKLAKKTFDPFDSALGDEYGHYKSITNIHDRFSIYRREFYIDPLNWMKLKPAKWIFSLKWQEYRYADIKQPSDWNHVIKRDEPGIYIFYARADQLIYKFPVFAFYIGISNEKNSKRSLRDRLKDYAPTSINSIKKRENIHRMFQLYYEHIWVAFALTNVTSKQLSKAERILHGYLYPCCNRRDFPIIMKKQQQAFGGI